MNKERAIASKEEYFESLERFFDEYSTRVDVQHRRHKGYHQSIAFLASFYIPANSRVLEVGSGNGDFLAALNPSYGAGVDISRKMVDLAAAKYPNLRFRHMAAECMSLDGEQFDFVVLSDLVSYLYDIRLVFERLRAVCTPRTRIIMHWYSRVWQPILGLCETVGLKYPQPLLNWTSVEDITNLLYLANFEVTNRRPHILFPVRVPLVSNFVNRYLAHLPVLRSFCLTQWMVARPLGIPLPEEKPRVSIVSPCRNEAGNIEPLVRRLPVMGSYTELIFVEGHSRDNTLEECKRVAASRPDSNIKVLQQQGTGKADAVQRGFSEATGDILMILDADLSVAPEDLPQFYETIVSRKGDFINGSRLVYAMDRRAMRFLNLLGNKFFVILLSSLLGQPIKDTLCGTKVLWRDDYSRIAQNRFYFGDFDPFGDFDLLFGAAKLNLKITEIPIRYRERTYGTTNISRFTHGWLLLKMSAKAASKLLFIT
jgi:ubiquinone/menaquinone biosynthesis C-methylase UbiE